MNISSSESEYASRTASIQCANAILKPCMECTPGSPLFLM
nr:MAG TPA: hypothetical protein [Caudoviricetes sp.]